jgi:gas vesicle protein
MGGFAMGESGGKMKGALGGAASGAMMGAVAGPIGMGVGAVAGFVGGLFGGAKKAKEERKALEANKIALAEQYGGMENLRKIAGDLGVDISKAFDAKKPAQFEAAVKELNAALEDQKTRLEGLNTALAGVNDRATIFGDKFAKVFEATQGDDSGAAAKATAKMAAMAQASEAEFAGLGLMVRDTFAGLVKETGSGIAALQQMGPAFQVLEDGVSKWGLTSTAVIDELRANFALVNDTAFKPLFEQITATGNVLRGLMDAEALSPEGFQAIAADIGASLQGIANKGGDMSKALALSQPVLQKLWEAQEQYGEITDDTTSAILKQAEEQGLVGGQMKDTNQKILDVLLAIGNVLGADLPKYFEGLKKPADDAAMSIENSFSKIEIKPLTIGYRYDALNKPPEGVSVPHYAAGGIVRRPTLAMIGEAGPEAIVPLSGSALGAAATYETTIVLDGEVLAKSAAKRMPKYMREMGVGH